MENNPIEFTLPPAPRGLCFDRNDFVNTNFSVDNFLAEHQNGVTMDTMRDDLGVYLKVLRLAMIELINKDYANFVNLCATLIGFDKAIDKIQVPLGQLNEEVLSVKHCLEDAMKELSVWLSQRHNLQKKKQLIKYYSHSVNCLKTLDNILKNISEKKTLEKIAMADRSAMQYNHLKFSIQKCENLISPENKLLHNEIEKKLIQVLNDLLFEFFDSNDEENLLKTLLILASLDRVTETETLIRKQVVCPLLQDIISESALQKSKGGLQELYEKILSLLDTKLKLLLTVTQHSKLSFAVKKYRFLVNCFWCEVENRIEVNLSSIFAPGNPQVFYRRYNDSMVFLRKLEKYCSSKETVQLLHETIEFKSFQRRWNLPVYFQIRFQEIAGNYEGALQSTPTAHSCDGFLLKETYQCWKSLQECWSDGVFIEALAHKFWKLTLQILSRYATWASTYCTQKAQRTEPSIVDKDLVHNSITIYIDLQTLLQKLPAQLNLIKSKVAFENAGVLLRQSIKFSEEALNSTKNKIRDCIVNELYEDFNIQLKQVSDIPRLYRKTNRSVPTKACPYIVCITKAIQQFDSDATKRLDTGFLLELYQQLFNNMTVCYYKYVEDVLTSVQKTEESLRRLKQIREMTSQPSSETTSSTDGDKIRLQLNVDVVSYGKLAESLRIDVHSVHKFPELSSMVTEAVKSIDIK